jgi:hypothetical protein
MEETKDPLLQGAVASPFHYKTLDHLRSGACHHSNLYENNKTGL